METVLSVTLVGHSFIHRLAYYALSVEAMHMDLDERDCTISFIGRGGMTIARLRHKSDSSLSRRPDVVLLEIVINDIAALIPFV